MSEIIEILTAIPAESPAFTVNVSALSVDMIKTTGGSPTCLLYNALGFKRFQANDNFRILSCGIVLPENFALAHAPIEATTGSSLNINFKIKKATAAVYTAVREFGSQGSLNLPFVNYDQAIDVFVDVTSLNYDFNLQGFMGYIGDIKPRVSMINVPASLDGYVQTCILYVKILHNLVMIADS